MKPGNTVVQIKFPGIEYLINPTQHMFISFWVESESWKGEHIPWVCSPDLGIYIRKRVQLNYSDVKIEQDSYGCY